MRLNLIDRWAFRPLSCLATQCESVVECPRLASELPPWNVFSSLPSTQANHPTITLPDPLTAVEVTSDHQQPPQLNLLLRVFLQHCHLYTLTVFSGTLPGESCATDK